MNYFWKQEGSFVYYTGLCLIENASGRDTEKVTTGAFYKYGLFQIKSRQWCGRGYKGELCDIKCESKWIQTGIFSKAFE